MLHVALGELAAGGAQNMAAGGLRPREGQRHAVLQLVAEAVGAAGLIERRARPDAAGEGLIQQPAVEHDVHRAVRRFHLDGTQCGAPVLGDFQQHGIQIRLAITLDQCPRSLCRWALTDKGDDFNAFAGSQFDACLQGRARVHAGACDT